MRIGNALANVVAQLAHAVHHCCLAEFIAAGSLAYSPVIYGCNMGYSCVPDATSLG